MDWWPSYCEATFLITITVQSHIFIMTIIIISSVINDSEGVSFCGLWRFEQQVFNLEVVQNKYLMFVYISYISYVKKKNQTKRKHGVWIRGLVDY